MAGLAAKEVFKNVSSRLDDIQRLFEMASVVTSLSDEDRESTRKSFGVVVAAMAADCSEQLKALADQERKSLLRRNGGR